MILLVIILMTFSGKKIYVLSKMMLVRAKGHVKRSIQRWDVATLFITENMMECQYILENVHI